MEIIEYFTSENKAHWLEEIKKSDWGAGQYLYQLLSENRLKEMVGATALVPMLIDGEKLVSFCTLAPLDDIQPTDLSPWVGFVYTFPEYRGHHYIEQLLDYAESIATIMGKEYIYISTGHVGLYEKYGYEFFRMDKDIEGEDSRIYRKALTVEGSEKDERNEKGGRWKTDIVKKARKGIDVVAYCGFSCNHCFLGEWCGGCRSVFNCCSYGALFPGGHCPNIQCCQERKLDGCYECKDLETCTKGFYAPSNNEANACKVQALFIRKYGKEIFLLVHEELGKQYDAKKAQEILCGDIKEGFKLLEGYMSRIKE